ncbi:hypothetical protein Tco_0932782, partial [Tanacetum coccineum]
RIANDVKETLRSDQDLSECLNTSSMKFKESPTKKHEVKQVQQSCLGDDCWDLYMPGLIPFSTTDVSDGLSSSLFSTESSESKKPVSLPSVEGSPGAIYQPGWGVTNDCRLDTLEAYQDMIDHTVAMGSQLRLRFEQEVRLLKKSKAHVARRDQRIHARENEIKNLEDLLEAEADIKKAAEATNSEIVKELESLRA